ncbi:Rv1733c family protein [Streptomyces sp. A1-5]|uniref:Rv1733c family protein n=1 Tax=Streptomyces sp. A1-5 TaxID=2738410 RepID=UPI003FA6BB3A
MVARWTGPDGGPRTGEVAAPRPVEPGDRFRLWTDDRGRAVPRPLDEGTAQTHTALAALGAAAAAGGLVEGARRLAVRQLMARRFRRWEAAWARAGQDWGRADAGS